MSKETHKELVGEWSKPPISGGIPIPNEDYIKNIRANMKLDLPNVKLESENDKIMVMVCGGPTAQFYLDDIRKKLKDPKYVVFCSNQTHNWLIENGIVPHYQFMIDPKKSKIKDVQKPHKDVTYLIGVCCVPEVFEALKDYKVKRLFSLCGLAGEDGRRDIDIVSALFDKDEFVPLEGGTMAGLRAMTLANILGFRTVEFYGFDSGFFKETDDGAPIYYSYKKDRGENVLECECDDGKMFLSTPVFASQAREFIKWKHRLEWIKFIIHGDSFTAHINMLDDKAEMPKTKKLISDYMLEMNKGLFSKASRAKDKYGNDEYQKQFGTSGKLYAGQVAVLAGGVVKKHGKTTLLDYGCGLGTLKKHLPPIKGLEVIQYDPCIEEHSKRPEPADIVVCTDVLEHVEKDCLTNVLDDLQKLTKKVCFVAICLTPSAKTYSDGRNCHLALLEHDIWYAKLRKRFRVVEQERKKGQGGHDMYIMVLQAKDVK